MGGGWTRLVADICFDDAIPNNPFAEDTIWFALPNRYADYFSTATYDPFLLVTYYVAMQWGQDLRVCGNVSAKLYHNLTNYIQRIYMDFSDALEPVNLIVDGFDDVDQDGDIVGAGISCGVDSLSTLYDHYIKESVQGYKINTLFLFNAGTHGLFSDSNTRVLFHARYESNKRAADELGLPIIPVDSNIHFFQEVIGVNKLVYLANWSCVLSMQRKIKKYYVASCFSYEQIIEFHKTYHDLDIDEFCGIYLVPLIQTNKLELIYDGAQYRRTAKTQNIVHWEIAQKYLNVCLVEKETSENCSCCQKCLRTLSALEALDSLEEFSNVFNLEIYKQHRFANNCAMVMEIHKNAYSQDNVEFAREHGMKLPPKLLSYVRIQIPRIMKNALIKVFGLERCISWKKALINTLHRFN